MTKIKGITLENFRTYDGSHNFSFIGKKGLSNLVVVYAPNGYGKTSLFDGIEWALSNKIRRFENGVLKQELESKDFADGHQIVLTNRPAFARGEKGSVKIFTDRDETIERKVVPRQIPGTKLKNDYRPGKLTGAYSTSVLNELAEYNMLTQDQIDAFLRFKTPEEKFDALKEFWPEGSKAGLVYKKISEYSKVMKNKLSELQGEVKIIKLEIGGNLNSQQNFQRINNWISKFNIIDFFDIRYHPITESIDEKVYAAMTRSSESYLLLLGLSIENLELIGSRIAGLQANWPSYLTDKRKIELAEIDVRALRKLQGKFELLKNNGKDLEFFSTEIRRKTILKSDLLGLKNNWKSFVGIESEIEKLEANSLALLDGQQLFQKSLLESEQMLARLSNRRSGLLKQIEELNRSQSKIESSIKQIASSYQEIGDGNRMGEFLEYCRAVYSLERSALQKLRHQTYHVLESFDFSEYKTEDKDLISRIDEYKVSADELKLITEQITALELRMADTGSFAENLDRLVEWAGNQILTEQLNNCPMCHTEFADTQALLLALSRDRDGVLMLSELQKQMFAHGITRTLLSEKKDEHEKWLISHFQLVISKLNLQIEEYDLNIDNLESAKMKVLNKIEFTYTYLNVLREDLNISEDAPNLNQIDWDDYITSTVKFLTDRKDDLKQVEADIVSGAALVSSTNNSILVSKNALAENANKVLIHKGNPVFSSVSGLLEKYAVGRSGTEENEVDKMLETCELELRELNKKVTELTSSSKTITEQLESDPETISEIEIPERLGNIEAILQEFNPLKNDYEVEFRSVLEVENVEQQVLVKAQSSNHERLGKLKQLREDLNSFSVDLKVIEQDVRRNVLKTTLQLTNKTLSQVKRVIEKLEKGRIDCGNYIKSGIDEYFNKKVINQIYGKIEPHPKLTEIDISSDFNDKPKLMIKAKSANESLAPGLFLSAGQVNVLSLSIFIARAYELGSGDLDTIFMDDPVQNMSDINVLSFIDLLRILIMDQDRQVVISTHDESFYQLLQHKLSDNYFNSKFIELGSYGKIKDQELSPIQ